MKRIILSILVLLFSSFIFAQISDSDNYVTRIWNSSDGLPGNSISDIIQTSDGYIYFGTYESLVRFDGFEFQNINKYSNSNYAFLSARSLFEDSMDNIWVGSNDEGVQKISKDSTIHYSTANGLPNNSIRAFTEDKYHNIWIGTASGIRYLTPEGQFISPKINDSEYNIEHVLVSQLYRDSADKIWMITSENKGVFVYSDGAFQRFTGLDSFGDFSVSSMGQDMYGNFLFSLNQEGIVKYSNGKTEQLITDTVIDSFPTHYIFCDKYGTLWFGTQKGVVIYKDGVFKPYQSSSALSNCAVNKILEDREGNIWIITDSEGVGKISFGKFQMKQLGTAVNAICEDKTGKVWIGTDEGLLCYDDDNLIENELTELCKDIRIRHIELAKNGDLLVNCYTKPAQIRYTKQGEIQTWSTTEGLAGNKTRVSIETSKGELFVGTTTGLSVISKDGTITNYSTAQGFNNDYIMCLFEDNSEKIWIGTDGGGVYVMKDGKIVDTITTENGLAGNVIFKINQDSSGNFWICTGSGISKYDGENKTFFNYTSANGLNSDSVFQMIQDDSNIVWMISNRGISSAAYEDFIKVSTGTKQLLDCKSYNQNDGLKTAGANSTALSMKDSHGRVWFTMTDGFAIYNPLQSKNHNILPIIHLQSVKIDETEYTDFDKTIIIPPGTKHIDIKYTGLSFAASERNRFTHILEGFDKKYSELSTNRTVSYTNLKPGEYTFYVNIVNAEEYTSPTPASVVFIQKPFFYQRYTFWIILITGIIAIIILIFYITIRENKKRQLRLETKIQMATVELEMAKDDSDRLLKSILPVTIADRLKGIGGEKTIADRFENVTVLFADIVGFTKTTSNESAEDIVNSLNNLITKFDKRAAKMGVEKIKTMGDAYMAVCGVPTPNENHAEIMLKFAVGMYSDLSEYNKTAKIKFNLRIGLNSGPVIAGVIGQNKFIYDIWGDTVNVASRMESYCTPGHIRMTASVKDAVESPFKKLKCRIEECDVKGKGLMQTYEIPEN